MREEDRNTIHVHTDPVQLLGLLEEFTAPPDLVTSLAAENPGGR